jgi:hypothetical protein
LQRVQLLTFQLGLFGEKLSDHLRRELDMDA